MTIYDMLGVGRVVNASANNSRLGGCLMAPEVVAAMAEASTWFVDIEELKRAAGKYLAEITGAEDGLVTSGAAAALLLGTAACITRGDQGKMTRLPENDGAEVILLKGQLTGYHQAIRVAGARMIEVGLPYLVSPQEVASAINNSTVALCFAFSEFASQVGMIPLPEMIQIGADHSIPVLVDAAVASYPPSRLREFIALGADLVAFSGAKHIYGPPATGFICGRAELIEACRMQAGPEYGIGRPMKVSKEAIAGLVRALQLYVERDVEAEQRGWEKSVSHLLDLLGRLPFLRVSRMYPDEVGRPVPRVRVEVDSGTWGGTARELVAALRRADPSVRTQEFLVELGVIILNPLGLLEGDEELIYRAFCDARPLHGYDG